MRVKIMKELVDLLLEKTGCFLVGSAVLAYADPEVDFRDIDFKLQGSTFKEVCGIITAGGFSLEELPVRMFKDKQRAQACPAYPYDTIRKITIQKGGVRIPVDLSTAVFDTPIERQDIKGFSHWYTSQLIVEHLIPVQNKEGVYLHPLCTYSNLQEIVEDVKVGKYRLNSQYSFHPLSVFNWCTASIRLERYGFPYLSEDNYPDQPWTYHIEGAHNAFIAANSGGIMSDRRGRIMLIDHLDYCGITDKMKRSLRGR